MASSRSCSVTSSHRHAIVFMRLARERRRPSAPFVLAARLARLEDGHPNERRQGRLDALPHPRREELAGRVLEARQLIQVVVVEERVERRPRVVEELVVYEPAGARVDRARHGELDPKAVPMESRALVPRGHLREPMGRLEAELVHEPDVHGNHAGRIQRGVRVRGHVHRPFEEAAQGESPQEQPLPRQAQGQGSRPPRPRLSAQVIEFEGSHDAPLELPTRSHWAVGSSAHPTVDPLAWLVGAPDRGPLGLARRRTRPWTPWLGSSAHPDVEPSGWVVGARDCGATGRIGWRDPIVTGTGLARGFTRTFGSSGRRPSLGRNRRFIRRGCPSNGELERAAAKRNGSGSAVAARSRTSRPASTASGETGSFHDAAGCSRLAESVMRDLFFLTCGGFASPGLAIRPLGEAALQTVTMTNTVAVVVRDSGDLVLVDAGWDGATCEAPAREMGRMRALVLGVRLRREDAIASQLRGLGLDPGRVSAIVATHLHLESVSGAIDFPNAEVVVSQSELKAYWDAPRRSLYRARDLARSGRIRALVLDGTPTYGFPGSVDPFGRGDVVMLDARGHSAGSVAVALLGPAGTFVHEI